LVVLSEGSFWAFKMTSRVGFYRPLGGAPLEDNVNQTYLKATGFSADGSKPSPMISPVDETM